ncbi:MAG: regulatory protein [Frankiales bacterium]|nr:regulatory protein [Frankiales bacterium]
MTQAQYSPPVNLTGQMRQPPEQVTALAVKVLADLEVMTDRLVEAILAEDPSYGLGRTTREDLRRSCHDNLERILQSLTGEPSSGDVFDAPHATGHRRAEQGMPLESVLHAYRLGHRGIWDALVAQARDEGALEGLVEAASYVWELVDSFSSEVARAFRETERVLHRRDDRRRDALVDALLDGQGRSRAVAADAAAGLDLPEHGRYVVLVLDGTEAGRPVADALSVRGVRAAWRTRADREIGLVHLTSDADLAKSLEHVAGLRAGLSPIVTGLAQVDGAHRLAETALRALPPGASGISELDARLPGALLVTAPDLAARLVARALGGLLALDPEERDVLLLTLATWLDTGGSAGQTATRLFCHRNTVLNRLRRVESLTGRSLERVDHLVEWSLALLAREVLVPDTSA